MLLQKCSEKGINFFMQLFGENRFIKCCMLKEEFNAEGNTHIWYIKLVHAIPNGWKSNILQMNSNTDVLTINDLHFILRNLELSKLIIYTIQKFKPFLLEM